MMSNSLIENSVAHSLTLSCDEVKGHSILLIENDLELSALYKKQLCSCGYQVKQKRRDDSIQDSITKNRPDMIVIVIDNGSERTVDVRMSQLREKLTRQG